MTAAETLTALLSESKTNHDVLERIAATLGEIADAAKAPPPAPRTPASTSIFNEALNSIPPNRAGLFPQVENFRRSVQPALKGFNPAWKLLKRGGRMARAGLRRKGFWPKPSPKPPRPPGPPPPPPPPPGPPQPPNLPGGPPTPGNMPFGPPQPGNMPGAPPKPPAPPGGAASAATAAAPAEAGGAEGAAALAATPVGWAAAIAAAAIAAEVAMVALALKIDDFAKSVVESNRKFANYSPEMAATLAQQDIRESLRMMQMGTELAPSAGTAAKSEQDLADSLKEMKVLLQDIMNVAAAVGADVAKMGVDVAKYVPGTPFFWAERWKELKQYIADLKGDTPTSAALAQALYWSVQVPVQRNVGGGRPGPPGLPGNGRVGP